jgi:hypothetical protein
MSNPIEEHINYYQHFAPNPIAFRESLDNAIVYAKNQNKNLNMDLRDYFAAKAMQGLLSREPSPFIIGEKLIKASYDYADEMMKEREE